ncbi:MAG: hypothetical protein ABGX16_25790 [Pirellulales bacterium]
MAQQHDPQTQPSPVPEETPQGVSTGQTVATVLLLLHLFCLAIGVVSNVGSLSPIRQALRNVPFVPKYLQFLNMDRGYDYPLTLGAPDEGSYQLQLTTQANGADSTIIRLPDSPTISRIRRHRYEYLALRIADLVAVYEGDPHHQTLLPAEIGNYLLRELSLPAGSYQLKVQHQASQRLEDLTMGLAPEAPSTIVGINLMVSSTGELQLALQEKENLTATVRGEGQQQPIQ